jgi:hypothetical protein
VPFVLVLCTSWKPTERIWHVMGYGGAFGVNRAHEPFRGLLCRRDSTLALPLTMPSSKNAKVPNGEAAAPWQYPALLDVGKISNKRSLALTSRSAFRAAIRQLIRLPL